MANTSLGFDPNKNARDMSPDEFQRCQAWLLSGKSLEAARKLLADEAEREAARAKVDAERDAQRAAASKEHEDGSFRRACLSTHEWFENPNDPTGPLLTRGEYQRLMHPIETFDTDFDAMRARFDRATPQQRAQMAQTLRRASRRLR